MKREHSVLVSKVQKDGPKENRRTNDTTFDRIYKYYHNSKTRIVLDETEEWIRIRWETAWFLLVRAKSQKDVADELEKMYQVSKSLAYDDVRHAMMLFGDPRQNVTPAKRAIAETIALKGIEYAEKIQDLMMMERFLQKYIDINGLKEIGNDGKLEEMIKKLKAHQINIVSKPTELEAEANRLHEELLKTKAAK